MKVVSLFSGAGGLDLGFKNAGFQIVWANDIDSDAVLTYKKNIGDHIVLKDL
ncbi:DNA cytosine methyltransferase, partial [Escherichia coli]